MIVSNCKSCQLPLDPATISFGFRYCRSCHDQYKQARREKQARSQKNKPTVVYFIRAGDDIKIGYTEDIKARMAKMQTDNNNGLELLKTIAGGEMEENALHLKFAASHKERFEEDEGEWFYATKELMDFINNL